MSVKQQTENEAVTEEPVIEGELLAEEALAGQPATSAGPGTEEQPEGQVDAAAADQSQQELEALKRQVQENLDAAMRARAELDNLRKRSLRDVENAHKYALDKFANELLPVIDSLELGINAANDSDGQDSLKEGMQLTLKMFRDVLEKFGVSEVESEGARFDPEKHEAVSMQELQGAESGTVATVLQKGYTLNGRLIRPAMVVVVK